MSFTGPSQPKPFCDSNPYVCFGASDSETIKCTKQCLPSVPQFKYDVFHGNAHWICVCVSPRGGGSGGEGLSGAEQQKRLQTSVGVLRRRRGFVGSTALLSLRRSGAEAWDAVHLGSRTSVALWGRGHPISSWGSPRGTPAFAPLLALGGGKSPVFSALPLHLHGKQHSLFTNVHHQSFKDAWLLFDS